MKKMKKLLSMLLAVVMVLAMAVPSFADTTNTSDSGSITISNATKDKEYNVYKIFEATLGAELNGERPISYTATESQKEWFEKVDDNPFTFTETSDSDVFYVTVTDNNKDKVASFLQKYISADDNDNLVINNDFLNHLAKNTPVATEIAQDNTLTFTGLDYGYYLVTSSMGALITLDSANPEVTVIDKNQPGPSEFDKKIVQSTTVDGDGALVEDDTVNYGDVVTYEVKIKTTNYEGTKPIASYKIEDILAEGLSYKAVDDKVNPIKVYVGSVSEDNEVKNFTLSNIERGTFERKAVDENKTPITVKGSKFDITIPWATYNENTKAWEFTKNAQSSDTLIIRYQVVVEDTAVIGPDGNKNYAKYTFSTWNPTDDNPNPEEPEEPKPWQDERVTTVYTYALAINKTNSDNNPLAGAIFELTDVNGNKVNVRKEEATDGYKGNVYLYDPNGTSNQVVSPENGLIIVKGLKDANYTLTEVMAPEGFNLLTESISVPTLKTGDVITTTTKFYYDENGNLIKTETDTETSFDNMVPENSPVYMDALKHIENVAGTLLPSTGGIGTTIFYAAGIILMAGAVFFVVRRKKA